MLTNDMYINLMSGVCGVKDMYIKRKSGLY